MDRTYFYPFGRHIIYIREMLIMRQGFVKFKGYYHEEETSFPIERLLFHNNDAYWIRIDSKKQYDMDVSNGFYDEDVGANICLFPSYVVELTFSVIMKNPPKEKMDEIISDIYEDEKLIRGRDK
jgi:hypothetical protein